MKLALALFVALSSTSFAAGSPIYDCAGPNGDEQITVVSQTKIGANATEWGTGYDLVSYSANEAKFKQVPADDGSGTDSLAPDFVVVSSEILAGNKQGQAIFIGGESASVDQNGKSAWMNCTRE